MTRALTDLDWPATTRRLSLRRAEPRDALPTFAFRSQEAVAQWLTTWDRDVEDWQARFVERSGSTLIIEKDGAVVGDLYLHVQDHWSQSEVREQAVHTLAEIGYVVDPAHAGRGYATEAVRELLRLCFVELGVRRVVAACFADNQASWRLMERVGMRREQYGVQDSLHRSGQWLDGMTYALLADEWRAAQADAPSEVR